MTRTAYGVGAAERRSTFAIAGVMLLLALLWLAPFATLVLSAVRSQGDLIGHGVFSWPQRIAWSNFTRAWETGHFSVYFRNSLLVIALKVPLGLLLAALAAYPLAKLRFPLRDSVFVLLLAGIAVPVQVTLQPLLTIMRQIGMGGSLLALLPPYLAFGIPFQVFVLRGFFRQVPDELLEAARIDGGGEFRIFWQIVLPLAGPALATLAIVDVLANWNEFLIALVLINDENWRTVPMGLLQFQGEFSSQYTVLMAGVLLSVLPVLAIFLFLQRYFVAGLTAGAVKG